MPYHIRDDGRVDFCRAKQRTCKYIRNPHISDASYERITNNAPEGDRERSIWLRIKEEKDNRRLKKANTLGQKIINNDELDKILESTKPYTEWHPEITALKKEHPLLQYGQETTRTNTSRFQLINFLAHHQEKAFSGEQIGKINQHLTGKPSRDPIQAVNKIDQEGLVRGKTFRIGKETYYSLSSIEYTDKHLYKRVVHDDFGPEEQKAGIERGRKYFGELANDDYELGHMDPRKPLTADNSVMQPAIINGAYRDTHIFDKAGLPRVPNPEVFAKNPDKFYKDKEDRRIIYESLKKEFDK